MGAKEYLRKYAENRDRIRQLQDIIKTKQEDLSIFERTIASIKAIDYSVDKISSSQGETMEDRIIRMVDSTKYITDQIAKLSEKASALMQQCSVIESQINSIENPEHRQILHERYIKRMGMYNIADLMHFNYYTIIRKHGEALTEFENIFLKEEKST